MEYAEGYFEGYDANGSGPSLRPQTFAVPDEPRLVDLNLDSKESNEIQFEIRRNSWGGDFPIVDATRIQIIENPSLYREYTNKRWELESEGRSRKELEETYLYRVEECGAKLNSIISNGLCVDRLSTRTLGRIGENTKGVSVWQCPDICILSRTRVRPADELRLLVFKITKGRVTAVDSRLNAQSPQIKPTLYYDCHIPKPVVINHHMDPVVNIMNSTIVFLYEIKYNHEIVSRPRHVLPYAVVTFTLSNKPHTPPMIPVKEPNVEIPDPSRSLNKTYFGDEKVDCCAVWQGELTHRGKSIGTARFLSGTPLNIGLEYKLHFDSCVSLNDLQNLTFSRKFKDTIATAWENAVTFEEGSYNVFVVRPDKGWEYSVDKLATYLHSSEKAALAVIGNDVDDKKNADKIYLIPACELTEEMGFGNLERYRHTLYGILRHKRPRQKTDPRKQVATTDNSKRTEQAVVVTGTKNVDPRVSRDPRIQSRSLSSSSANPSEASSVNGKGNGNCDGDSKNLPVKQDEKSTSLSTTVIYIDERIATTATDIDERITTMPVDIDERIKPTTTDIDERAPMMQYELNANNELIRCTELDMTMASTDRDKMGEPSKRIKKPLLPTPVFGAFQLPLATKLQYIDKKKKKNLSGQKYDIPVIDIADTSPTYLMETCSDRDVGMMETKESTTSHDVPAENPDPKTESAQDNIWTMLRQHFQSNTGGENVDTLMGAVMSEFNPNRRKDDQPVVVIEIEDEPLMSEAENNGLEHQKSDTISKRLEVETNSELQNIPTPSDRDTSICLPVDENVKDVHLPAPSFVNSECSVPGAMRHHINTNVVKQTDANSHNQHVEYKHATTLSINNSLPKEGHRTSSDISKKTETGEVVNPKTSRSAEMNKLSQNMISETPYLKYLEVSLDKYCPTESQASHLTSDRGDQPMKCKVTKTLSMQICEEETTNEGQPSDKKPVHSEILVDKLDHHLGHAHTKTSMQTNDVPYAMKIPEDKDKYGGHISNVKTDSLVSVDIQEPSMSSTTYLDHSMTEVMVNTTTSSSTEIPVNVLSRSSLSETTYPNTRASFLNKSLSVVKMSSMEAQDTLADKSNRHVRPKHTKPIPIEMAALSHTQTADSKEGRIADMKGCLVSVEPMSSMISQDGSPTKDHSYDDSSLPVGTSVSNDFTNGTHAGKVTADKQHDESQHNLVVSKCETKSMYITSSPIDASVHDSFASETKNGISDAATTSELKDGDRHVQNEQVHKISKFKTKSSYPSSLSNTKQGIVNDLKSNNSNVCNKLLEGTAIEITLYDDDVPMEINNNPVIAKSISGLPQDTTDENSQSSIQVPLYQSHEPVLPSSNGMLADKHKIVLSSTMPTKYEELPFPTADENTPSSEIPLKSLKRKYQSDITEAYTDREDCSQHSESLSESKKTKTSVELGDDEHSVSSIFSNPSEQSTDSVLKTKYTESPSTHDRNKLPAHLPVQHGNNSAPTKNVSKLMLRGCRGSNFDFTSFQKVVKSKVKSRKKKPSVKDYIKVETTELKSCAVESSSESVSHSKFKDCSSSPEEVEPRDSSTAMSKKCMVTGKEVEPNKEHVINSNVGEKQVEVNTEQNTTLDLHDDNLVSTPKKTIGIDQQSRTLDSGLTNQVDKTKRVINSNAGDKRLEVNREQNTTLDVHDDNLVSTPKKNIGIDQQYGTLNSGLTNQADKSKHRDSVAESNTKYGHCDDNKKNSIEDATSTREDTLLSSDKVDQQKPGEDHVNTEKTPIEKRGPLDATLSSVSGESMTGNSFGSTKTAMPLSSLRFSDGEGNQMLTGLLGVLHSNIHLASMDPVYGSTMQEMLNLMTQLAMYEINKGSIAMFDVLSGNTSGGGSTTRDINQSVTDMKEMLSQMQSILSQLFVSGQTKQSSMPSQFFGMGTPYFPGIGTTGYNYMYPYGAYFHQPSFQPDLMQGHGGMWAMSEQHGSSADTTNLQSSNISQNGYSNDVYNETVPSNATEQPSPPTTVPDPCTQSPSSHHSEKSEHSLEERREDDQSKCDESIDLNVPDNSDQTVMGKESNAPNEEINIAPVNEDESAKVEVSVANEEDTQNLSEEIKRKQPSSESAVKPKKRKLPKCYRRISNERLEKVRRREERARLRYIAYDNYYRYRPPYSYYKNRRREQEERKVQSTKNETADERRSSESETESESESEIQIPKEVEEENPTKLWDAVYAGCRWSESLETDAAMSRKKKTDAEKEKKRAEEKHWLSSLNQQQKDVWNLYCELRTKKHGQPNSSSDDEPTDSSAVTQNNNPKRLYGCALPPGQDDTCKAALTISVPNKPIVNMDDEYSKRLVVFGEASPSDANACSVAAELPEKQGPGVVDLLPGTIEIVPTVLTKPDYDIFSQEQVLLERDIFDQYESDLQRSIRKTFMGDARVCTMSLPVARRHFGCLIGKKGSVIKHVMYLTQTYIKTPFDKGITNPFLKLKFLVTGVAENVYAALKMMQNEISRYLPYWKASRSEELIIKRAIERHERHLGKAEQTGSKESNASANGNPDTGAVIHAEATATTSPKPPEESSQIRSMDEIKAQTKISDDSTDCEDELSSFEEWTGTKNRGYMRHCGPMYLSKYSLYDDEIGLSKTGKDSVEDGSEEPAKASVIGLEARNIGILNHLRWNSHERKGDKICVQTNEAGDVMENLQKSEKESKQLKETIRLRKGLLAIGKLRKKFEEMRSDVLDKQGRNVEESSSLWESALNEQRRQNDIATMNEKALMDMLNQLAEHTGEKTDEILNEEMMDNELSKQIRTIREETTDEVVPEYTEKADGIADGV